MTELGRSSRQRYQKYRAELESRKPGELSERERRKNEAIRPSRSSRRHRSFWTLLRRFHDLIRGYRRAIGVALAGLGIATLLGLLPIYGTKLIFDNVLLNKPVELPDWVP